MLQQWIERHGTPELRRALAEAYPVRKGAASLIITRISEKVGLTSYEQSDWLEAGTRTSPRMEAFEKRDQVLECVKELEVPEGWRVEVSQISRVALLDGSYFTGVLLEVRDEERKLLSRGALNFESQS